MLNLISESISFHFFNVCVCVANDEHLIIWKILAGHKFKGLRENSDNEVKGRNKFTTTLAYRTLKKTTRVMLFTLNHNTIPNGSTH